MFTGIIREIGVIEVSESKDRAIKISIRAVATSKEVGIGDSVCVDGACLTVSGMKSGTLSFDVMRETLKKTTIGSLRKRDKVNLETSLELKNGRLDGHMVSGHVDEVGVIKKITKISQNVIQIKIGVNPASLSQLVRKGSVAVSGISLTVNNTGRDFFVIDLIPHTLKETTMQSKRVGDKVNVEFDVIGKYVQKNLSAMMGKAVNEDLLRRNGFM